MKKILIEMDILNEVWSPIESRCTNNQKFPNCIKMSLFHAGYDNLLGISSLNEDFIAQAEEYLSSNGFSSNELSEKLTCCHSVEYKNSIANKTFKFLPGHKKLILMAKEIAAELIATNEESAESRITNIMEVMESFGPNIPNVLKQLVRTSLTNSQVEPNLNSYSDTIKYFAIYVYLMCGRQCYDVLNSNLAMPAASTIGKISI